MTPRLLPMVCWGVSLLAAGCSSPGTDAMSPAPGAPTQDAATRAAPVVVGRPARVFIFSGFDENCAPLAAPQITIMQPPSQGEISFVPGQETTIQYSLTGKCVGQRTTGTGVYYTARAGSGGTDRFALEARLATGEVATRTFEVRIEP